MLFVLSYDMDKWFWICCNNVIRTCYIITDRSDGVQTPRKKQRDGVQQVDEKLNNLGLRWMFCEIYLIIFIRSSGYTRGILNKLVFYSFVTHFYLINVSY